MSDPSLEPTPQARRGGRNERVEILDSRTIDQKPPIEASHQLGRDGEVQAPGNAVVRAVATSAPVEKRYRYIGDVRQVSMPPQDGVAGYRARFSPGKEVTSLTYDLKHLAAQGISARKPNPKLQRIDADGNDIDDD